MSNPTKTNLPSPTPEDKKAFLLAATFNRHSGRFEADMQTIADYLATFGTNIINSKDESGNTLAMHLAFEGKPQALTLLLEAGADLEAQNGGGNTALMLAAYRGFGRCTINLLKAGAAASAKNSQNGQTATDIAKANGKLKIVRLITLWPEILPLLRAHEEEKAKTLELHAFSRGLLTPHRVGHGTLKLQKPRGAS